VLIVWEIVVDLKLEKASLLSSPTRIVTAAIQDFGSGAIWPHIGTSFLEWAVGFALAIGVGIPFGLAVGMFRRLEYLVDPFLAALYATPTVAIAPLVILVLGIELPAKFFLVFLFGVLPMTIATINGVHSAERRYLDIARSFRAPAMLRFRSVILPSSVPYIIAGLRIAGGHALVGVIVAEFLAANAGLGFYISFNGTTLNSARVFLGILIIGAFGVFYGEVIRRIEAKYEVWRPALR
jgi:ABC-type nitrate/sulfonate/bicarbonate transport system permease component